MARFAGDKKTRRKGDKDIGCVVAIDNATGKVYQISHHTKNCNCVTKERHMFKLHSYKGCNLSPIVSVKFEINELVVRPSGEAKCLRDN
jgi:hypothetical protein